jgi:hypothetical protein
VASSAKASKTVVATVVLGRVTSGIWSVTTAAVVGDPCTQSPSVGQVCSDGTVYAGLSPDGNIPFFATPCDFGQTWSGSACTGAALQEHWSWGNTIATGATSNTSGKSNTPILFADNANADGPYDAASSCVNLTLNGHTDWYLPSSGELNVIFTQNGAIGNFNVTGVNYWTSTEVTALSAYSILFSSGAINGNSKTIVYHVRCVRHN